MLVKKGSAIHASWRLRTQVLLMEVIRTALSGPLRTTFSGHLVVLCNCLFGEVGAAPILDLEGCSPLHFEDLKSNIGSMRAFARVSLSDCRLSSAFELLRYRRVDELRSRGSR